MTSAKGQAAAAAEKPASAAHPSIRALERPANLTGTNAPGFGSDVVADTLRALQIPYIALNPGASYRGLHDSIVNFLGNETPQMLLCLHEESAVAIAHGYAKVTGKAMAAAVHSNVGLFHATMAMFNAWCDRFPVIVLGATGPVDAAKRRPWIDWIHTARDQGAIVRNYTKWDDQPASPAAAREAIIRATWIANTSPMGPVYINLDAEMQEAKLAEPLAPIDAARFMPQANPMASAELIQQAAAMLKAAKHPVILMGRVSRSVDGWNERIALAETLNAKVISDLKIGCGFPTDHPLHAGAPASNAMVPEAIEALKAADVILALDWVDLAGGLRAALGMEPPKAKVINVSADFHIHNGWSMDYEILPPVDLLLPTTPDDAVPSLLAALGGAKAPKPAAVKTKAATYEASSGPLRVDDLAKSLKAAVGDRRGHAHPPAALLERRRMAVPSSARLHRLGGRRRHRRRTRRVGGRGARAQGLGTAADRHLRRRRLLHGRDRDLDRGALPHSAPGRGLQQPLVLQRRTPPGARRPHPQPAGREPLDRPAHLGSGHRLRCAG